VGLEDFPVRKTEATTTTFMQHLDALRQEHAAFLQRATFVIAPECNMGLHAIELAHAVLNHRDRTPMHRGRILILDEDSNQFGIRTGDRKNPLLSKDNMRRMAAAVIDSQKLRFHSNMVCVCDRERGVTAADVLDRLVNQLQRYGADVRPPLRLGGRPQLDWHGKRGSGHDDLAMALQLNLVANRLFMAQGSKYGVS